VAGKAAPGKARAGKAAPGKAQITAGGITVPLTHPDKMLFPGDGITKADLARCYADVADVMLPLLRD
jgi:bifunctional non-homologous end joining protein LigD